MVLQGDPALDPAGTGTKILPFTRAATVRSEDGLDTSEVINIDTHFVDASMVGRGGARSPVYGARLSGWKSCVVPLPTASGVAPACLLVSRAGSLCG